MNSNDYSMEIIKRNANVTMCQNMNIHSIDFACAIYSINEDKKKLVSNRVKSTQNSYLTYAYDVCRMQWRLFGKKGNSSN